MQITVTVGTVALPALVRVMEEGLVTGVALNNHALTFDYTGLDADGALKRANDNLAAVRQAQDVDGDEEYGYAGGWFAVALTALAAEQLTQQKLSVEPDPQAVDALEEVLDDRVVPAAAADPAVLEEHLEDAEAAEEAEGVSEPQD